MKVKTTPKQELGQWFQSFELELTSYPTEVPCCVEAGSVEMMYEGEKKFKLISIDRNYSMNNQISPKLLKKGTIIEQHDCGKNLDKDKEKA